MSHVSLTRRDEGSRNMTNPCAIEFLYLSLKWRMADTYLMINGLGVDFEAGVNRG
jgi:hypothetical protein